MRNFASTGITKEVEESARWREDKDAGCPDELVQAILSARRRAKR
jgi:hypothetical protein